MKWKTSEMCDSCPFLDRSKLHISESVLDGIKDNLKKGDNFVCHKTAYPDQFENGESDKPLMCHGAWLYLTKLRKPNQIMQIAERIL